ncbi:MAG: cyclic nucleotide-binding domain-containing protein, partial [Burkholderiales bacterium]|nr:cyclic nucleotide-binding domain-containing protein [Burkholderiales bacterium]
PSAPVHRPNPSAPPRRHSASLIPIDVLNELKRDAASTELHEVSDEVELSQELLTSAEEDVGDALSLLTAAPCDEEAAVDVLSQVNLFASLSPAGFRALAQGAQLVDVPAGELLFAEGDEAKVFFVIVDGALEIRRKNGGRGVAMRHAHKGTPVGLFGLFSAAQRGASARAIGECTVLELPAENLQALLEADPTLNDRLWAYYRQRLIEGFVASAGFGELDTIAKGRLIGRFQARALDRGQVLLHPGEVTNLLAVVTSGCVVLEDRNKTTGQNTRLELGPGQFFACLTGMSGLPTKLRAVASHDATVELLTHKDFFELGRDYTALKGLGARLAQTGAQRVDRDVYTGPAGGGGV